MSGGPGGPGGPAGPGPAVSGLHVRAGNAMGRTREGLLDAALTSIERDGPRRLTMSGICERSGVAKATLYNHFRTKADVLAAVVWREVDRVADTARDAAATGGLADGLEAAAAYVATSSAARAVAASDPGALVALLGPSPSPNWLHARQRAAEVLDVDPAHPVVDVTLAWLGAALLTPGGAAERRATSLFLAEATRASTWSTPARRGEAPDLADVIAVGAPGRARDPVSPGATSTST